jgi:hypothetical protein
VHPRALDRSVAFGSAASTQGDDANVVGIPARRELVGRPQRDATPAEEQRLAASIRTTRSLQGHELLWRSLKRVRDMRFTSFSLVEYPVMCDGVWEP